MVQGTAQFHGRFSTEIADDESRMQRSGFCGIHTLVCQPCGVAHRIQIPALLLMQDSKRGASLYSDAVSSLCPRSASFYSICYATYANTGPVQAARVHTRRQQ